MIELVVRQIETLQMMVDALVLEQRRGQPVERVGVELQGLQQRQRLQVRK